MEKLDKVNGLRRESKYDDFVILMDQVIKLNNEYLTLIPKKKTEFVKIHINSHSAKKELKLLQDLLKTSYQFRITLGAIYNSKKINPYDYIYGCLGLNLQVVDHDSQETELILNYLNVDSLRRHSLVNIIKVSGMKYSKKDEEKFLTTKNHLMLWHGTKSLNILSIMKNGLVLQPNHSLDHEGDFKDRLYFADSFNLSHCFSSKSKLLLSNLHFKVLFPLNLKLYLNKKLEKVHF